jgi:hypothetical protein
MTRTVYAYSLLIFLSSCRVDANDNSATFFPQDHISFVAPTGWSIHRDRGTLILNESIGHNQSTISVRSVPATGWTEKRTPANVLPSVSLILSSLPNAKITGPLAIHHPIYQAIAYDVDFSHQSRQAQHYWRRHVVIFSSSRIIHALYTGPRDRSVVNSTVFDGLIESIREEI